MNYIGIQRQHNNKALKKKLKKVCLPVQIAPNKLYRCLTDNYEVLEIKYLAKWILNWEHPWFDPNMQST